MKTRKEKMSIPLSLDGCEQVFKQCNIPPETYMKWTIGEIFEFAINLAKRHNISVDEIVIDPLG